MIENHCILVSMHDSTWIYQIDINYLVHCYQQQTIKPIITMLHLASCICAGQSKP